MKLLTVVEELARFAKKTGVKVIYEQEVDGAKQNICKVCKAMLENKKASTAK